MWLLKSSDSHSAPFLGVQPFWSSGVAHNRYMTWYLSCDHFSIAFLYFLIYMDYLSRSEIRHVLHNISSTNNTVAMPMAPFDLARQIGASTLSREVLTTDHGSCR